MVNRFRKLIIFVSLGLGLGGGLFYLDSQHSGDSDPSHVVGAMGPGSQFSTPVTGSDQWPDDWVSCGGGPDDPVGIVVTEKTPNRQTLVFKLPGFYLKTVSIGGRKCSRVSVPELMKVMEAGLPELPVATVSLVVPSGGRTFLKIRQETPREIKMDPVEPSTGHLARNIDPATVVPEFSDFYDNDGMWPKTPVDMGTRFTVREYEGISVQVNPLRYDAGKGALIASEYLVIDVVTEGGLEKSGSDVSVGDDPEVSGYGRVYRRLFANYSEPARVDKYQRLPVGSRMLIVSHDAFVPDLEDFIAWKGQRGMDVTVATVSELGGTAEGIGQAIAAMYDEPAGLTWVILVGDREQVPTNVGLYDGSDSDTRYAMVAGGDIYPDLFVSRISASTSEQVQTQVNRFITYEKTPDTGSAADWYGKAAGIASDEGSPSDFARADLLRTDLLNYGFTSVNRIYQSLSSGSTDIRNAVESGVSLVNYLGHGSGYGWTSVPFSRTDVHNLDNRDRWPWIIDVSCSNGDFAIDECFAEAWLRAGTPDQPTGAVAMIAASSLAPWVPPTMMQAEAVDLLVAEEAISVGSLYFSGLMRVLDSYPGQDVAEMVIEQNVIFGDCSLLVRTRAPQAFLVAANPTVGASATEWTLDVDGPAGSMVTLTADGVLLGRGAVSDAQQAQVTLTEPLSGRSAVTLTVTGFNMIPHIENVAVVGGNGGAVSPQPEPADIQPAVAALMGNYPNPFNPRTSIVFELPRDMRAKLAVYDMRGSLVRVLLDEGAAGGRHEVIWDGRNSGGREAASGVYLYQLSTADGTLNGRMILTR